MSPSANAAWPRASAAVSSPSLDQRIEADEQRIARERGETLVRGIAVAGGTERQHLPEALAGRGEPDR